MYDVFMPNPPRHQLNVTPSEIALDGLSPTERAALLYCEVRRLRGQEPPTTAEVITALGVCERSVGSALPRLRRLGMLERI